MASTNVEVLRRFWELATVRREFDLALELCHADAEFDEARGASVWTLRDAKITGAKLFQSRSAALASVGLPG